MGLFCDNINIWLVALRTYSLPISVMSWFVPFLCALFYKGNILYGFIALFGIIVLHLATNIFDDTIDYIREKTAIDKGIKSDFNFQKGKCFPIFSGKLTIKQYILASFILFFTAFIISLFFLYLYGMKLLFIFVPTAILCLLYPVLGCLGLGEIIVAIVFSPLLYLGVYFVMTGVYSLNILLVSISTGLLSVAVLHNHMLLDFEFDEKNRKITLCRLCKTPAIAFYFLILIIVLAYLNIILCCYFKLLSPYFLLSFLSIPTALTLFAVMYKHVKNPDEEIKKTFFMGSVADAEKAPVEQRNFLLKFSIMRNLLSMFTALICIAVVLAEIF